MSREHIITALNVLGPHIGGEADTAWNRLGPLSEVRDHVAHDAVIEADASGAEVRELALPQLERRPTFAPSSPAHEGARNSNRFV